MDLRCPKCGHLVYDEGRYPVTCPSCSTIFDDKTPRSAGMAVLQPAWGLKAFAIMAIVLNCLVSVGIQLAPRRVDPAIQLLPQDDPRKRGADAAPFIDFVINVSLTCFTTLFLYPAIIWGASRMRENRNDSLSVMTCLLALLPCSFAWIFTAPMGLWGLIALMRSDVRASFHD
jgi:hypothetical protein